MSDMLVAQCPHCQTRFRVSEDHLQAAAGNVRCGACLKVFNARAQVNAAGAEGAGPPAAAAEPRRQPDRSEPSVSGQSTPLTHDDLEPDDHDLEALGLDESILEEINPDARTTPSGTELAAREWPSDTAQEQVLPPAPAGTEPATPAPDITPEHTPDQEADPLPAGELDAEDAADADAEQWFPEFPRARLADKPPVTAATEDTWKLTEEDTWKLTEEDTWKLTEEEIDQVFEFDSATDNTDDWNREFNLDDDLENSPALPTLTPAAQDDVELHEAFKSAARSSDYAPRPLPTAPTAPSAPIIPTLAIEPAIPTLATEPAAPTTPTTPAEPTPSVDTRPRAPAQDTPAPPPPLTVPPLDHDIFLRDQPAKRPDAEPPSQRQILSADAPFRQPEPPQQGRREPSLGSALSLPDLIDEPLYLDPRPLARRPRRQWLWLMLSAIAALALIGQIAFYNFATLAHDERTRPILEQLCFLAGCELPARVDTDLIRSSNLVVRPHPDFPNALAIDVILYNRADFAQPFPVLRMTFSDLSGRELGNKLFQPAEYLGGELAGSTLMPPQTPVHVGLSMLNPGPEATSYNLDFLSP